MYSEFNPRLRRDAGVEGVFDFAHLRYQVGCFDHARVGAAAGEYYAGYLVEKREVLTMARRVGPVPCGQEHGEGGSVHGAGHVGQKCSGALVGSGAAPSADSSSCSPALLSVEDLLMLRSPAFMSTEILHTFCQEYPRGWR